MKILTLRRRSGLKSDLIGARADTRELGGIRDITASGDEGSQHIHLAPGRGSRFETSSGRQLPSLVRSLPPQQCRQETEERGDRDDRDTAGRNDLRIGASQARY